ncbi:chemotaxis protein CheA [Herbaspirillum sp. meg3]|jgi:two-component system chemotaxis sensor kinase CheA|uniref:chemotaxis protein CheA n=1 Tax=Herbaspirillum sp. meg3 TaxID=2025949 RepID=UPI000B988026|nr:chemotaxis protein CheA [Herbaspirillum sp. meg3]ASU38368.1 chemotaxis protein CheA [Herbaspirillum sp. meg3]
MTIDMSQFFQVFFDEAEEGLAEMEKLLLAVNVSDPDDEDLNAIFRAAHSIKGGSATFGLTDITEITHVLESLLDRIRQGQMALTSQHVDAFLAAKDILKSMLDGHRHGATVDLEAVADVRMLLQSLSEGAGKKAAASQTPAGSGGMSRYRIELPQLAERELEALQQELGLLGTIEKTEAEEGRCVFILDTTKGADSIHEICSFLVNADDLKISQAVAARSKEEEQGYGFFAPFVPQDATDEERGYGFFAPFVPVNATDKERGYGFFEPFVPQGDVEQAKQAAETAAHGDHDEPPALAVSEHAGEKKAKGEKQPVHESSSIRVGIEKVDQLINLVGELVITQAMIEQRTGTLDPMLHEHLLNSVSQLTRNTRDLQESVMSIRMMPMDYVFSRFPRMVRDLAAKLNKRVEFVTHGAATELDKGLIERIVDPLTHLVRNSIDHGIEIPETRLAAGKTDYGTLSLSAEHQGGNIIIEVTDDGGGLNRERILAKAKQQGMGVSDNLSDSDVWQLIFEPGFSTAEQVTDVSGRGVGMDVVKRNILAMGGAVDIRSSKGFGTTISISLPLTLAILDGMSIRIGHEIYILPLGYVVESLQPATQDVKEISGQGKVIKVRGEYLPLLPLYQIFNIESTFTDPSQGLVVILESDGKKAALFVDDLIGQQQIVVKNLESNYRKVAGISGATILGDGGVALIIDVAALLRSTRQLSDESVFS